MPITLTPVPASADLITSARAVYNPILATLNGSSPAALAALISAASASIRGYCRRQFTAADYVEYHDGWGYRLGEAQAILLAERPVTAVSRVASCPTEVLEVRNTDAAANARATVATTSTGLVLVRVASGVSSTNTLAYATYPTLSALAAAIGALGNGWEAEVLGDYALFPSADLAALQGAADARNAAARLELYVEEVNGWRLNDQAGVLLGYFPEGQRNIRVDYAAGWAEVPEDVQAACVQHCVDLYLSEQRDSSLRREGIGGFSQYEVSRLIAGMSHKVRGMLGRYVDHSKVL